MEWQVLVMYGYFRLFKAQLARICSSNNPVMSIRARPDTRDLSLKHLVKYHILENRWITRLHYGTNARTLDFVIEAKRQLENRMQKIKGGTHGFWYQSKDMHTLYFMLKVLILRQIRRWRFVMLVFIIL
jgi:hypothetical protein